MFMMAGARSGAPTAVQTPVKMPVVTSGGYWIRLDSDHGDYVGGGRSYTFTPANSQVTVRASGNHLAIIVLEAKGPYGRNSWNGDFQEPSSLPELAKGTYTDLRRYPFNDPAKGGLDWSGEGRGSNELTGWFAIDKVSYKGGRLSAITLRFELHSEGGAPALHGEIEWVR